MLSLLGHLVRLQCIIYDTLCITLVILYYCAPSTTISAISTVIIAYSTGNNTNANTNATIDITDILTGGFSFVSNTVTFWENPYAF